MLNGNNKSAVNGWIVFLAWVLAAGSAMSVLVWSISIAGNENAKIQKLIDYQITALNSHTNQGAPQVIDVLPLTRAIIAGDIMNSQQSSHAIFVLTGTVFVLIGITLIVTQFISKAELTESFTAKGFGSEFTLSGASTGFALCFLGVISIFFAQWTLKPAELKDLILEQRHEERPVK